MNFIKSFVGSSLPYENEETVTTINETSFSYSLSHAKRKEDKAYVSLFHLSPSNPKQLNENCLKRFRTLKHPGFVKYYTHIPNEKNGITILTEEVYPLKSFIQSDKCTQDMILWGLFSLANALHFLNVNAKLSHYNIHMDSIFITKGGEWKLGGLQYVTDTTNPSSFKSFIDSNRKIGHLPNDITNEYIDSYSFSLLAKKVFSNPPQPLLSLLNGLNNQPITTFLTHPSVSTPFLTTVYNIDNYSILDPPTRKSFLISLTQQELPILFCRYKLIPFYIDLFRTNMPEANCVVESLLKLSEGLEKEEFNTYIQPFVTKFLSSTDLATRYGALTSLRYCLKQLPKYFIDHTIFPLITQSLRHQNNKIRDSAVRSLVTLISFLSESNITECAKQLSVLMNDESALVRTNTIVCVSKTMQHFSIISKKKLTIESLARSGKDTIKEMRLGAMDIVMDQLKEFSGEELALKFLPYISMFLIDKNSQVRIKSRQLFDSISKEVLQYSNQLDMVKDDPIDQQSNKQQSKQSAPIQPHLNLKKPGDVVYDQQKPTTKLYDGWEVSADTSSQTTSTKDVFSLFETVQPTVSSSQQNINEIDDDDINRLTTLIGKKHQVQQEHQTYQLEQQDHKGVTKSNQPMKKKQTNGLIFELPNNANEEKDSKQGDSPNDTNADYWDEWGLLNFKCMIYLNTI
ncbi:HEAT repeat domain containing protein [Entamoeba marina]